jgi:hypothetical protein
MWARQNVDGLTCETNPNCPVHLVSLVYLVHFVQPNKPDRPNRPNEQEARIVAQAGRVPEELWKQLNSCGLIG